MSSPFHLPLGLPPLPPELAALATPPGAAAENPDEIVRQAFRIGRMRLLAPFATASELTEMPNVYPLPRAPANLLGLVNLHGRIVPLFDLTALFETEHLPREKRMLLVIGHGDSAAGIAIDGLPRRMVSPPIRKSSRRSCRPPPPPRCASHTRRAMTPGSNSITRNYSINS